MLKFEVLSLRFIVLMKLLLLLESRRILLGMLWVWCYLFMMKMLLMVM